MNRTKEFLGYVNLPNQKKENSYKKVFYDSILEDIRDISKKINNKLTYSTILKLEDEIQNLVGNTTRTLGVLDLQGSKDEVCHFEGVKKILMMKLGQCKSSLEKIKKSKMGLDLELAPERPEIFREVKDVSHLEQVNLEIVENSTLEGYRLTRQRLLEIESIQDTINEHLQIQDERIDDVIGRTGEVHKSISLSKDLVEKGSMNSRFIRRFLFVLFLCLSFLILFLHLYYKS
ncbi:hypothetical protein NGRA_0214 [Nosema granulosis]|uniref:t-SNARE coiled-coil homology domain-containing protein n=1 Tax=Nosema granulosis TaxID=83296 RepID=A0A9P6H1B2_9MICR|nr:hypothetical protein NGRA_0214 [Nosema granulosis]